MSANQLTVQLDAPLKQKLDTIKETLDTLQQQIDILRPGLDSITDQLKNMSLMMDYRDDARIDDTSSLKSSHQTLVNELQACREKLETISSNTTKPSGSVTYPDLGGLCASQQDLTFEVQDCKNKIENMSRKTIVVSSHVNLVRMELNDIKAKLDRLNLNRSSLVERNNEEPMLEEVMNLAMNEIKKYVETKLQPVLEKLSNIQEKIDSEEKKDICTICAIRRINRCMMPCGHLYCDFCSEQTNTCPFYYYCV